MYKKVMTALRRFRRVNEFLTKHVVDGTQVKLQVLDQVVRELSENAVEQDASKRLTHGEVGRQSALRNAVWNRHMVPISRIAKRAFGIPGMDQKFALPPKRADNDGLLTAARGMLQAAEAHADVFVQQEGLPADFVERFRSATDELANALGVRIEGQRRKKTSREALQKLVKRGVATVDVLDAIVTPQLESKPELLATWKTVKRPVEPGGNLGGAATPDITPVVKVA